MRVLGIESSCDETSVGIVELTDGVYKLLSNVTATSLDLHAMYGGVVPEIAARSHIEHIIPVIEKALASSIVDSNQASGIPQTQQTTEYGPQSPISDPWSEIDAIAVTYGPGLGGSLLVGVCTARALAVLKNKPLYAINHVLAHPLATFITDTNLDNYNLPSAPPEFPMLSLTVSGGHTQLVLFKSAFEYEILGQTGDDAIGEAYDKVAKIIGLPYPGGPSIEKFAPNGNPDKFDFPKANLQCSHKGAHFGASGKATASTGQKGTEDMYLEGGAQPSTLEDAQNECRYYDFSFSGLKTAVLRTAQGLIGEDHSFPSKDVSGRLSEAQKADIAASFMKIATETVVDKTIKAYEQYQPKSVVIAGGVAASKELRRQLEERLPIQPTYTDIKLCTDNGAMIAVTGCMYIEANQAPVYAKTLDISPNLSM